jgi:hypothetical protein
VRTVSSLIDNRRAMPAFDMPPAAASTILARTTSRYGAVCERVNPSNRSRCVSSMTTVDAHGAIRALPRDRERGNADRAEDLYQIRTVYWK